MATVVAAAVAGPALVLAAAPAYAASDAMVSVFHGIPGATVDVYVNDKLTLDDFAPGDLAGPLPLPAGTYSVKITDPADASKIVIGPADIPVEGGMNYTIVAYLGEDGKPTAKPFVNDVKATKAGDGRVTVRHVAAAPAVTITASGTTLVPSLANGEEAVADVPAQSYKVGVAPASGGDEVFSTDLDVAEGVNTIVYAYGDLAGGTFAVGTQAISDLGSMPDGGVPGGEAGLANDGAVPTWVLLFAGLGLAGAAFAARRMATARS
jgi:hypothetical protein